MMEKDNFGFTAGPTPGGGIVTTKILEAPAGVVTERCINPDAENYRHLVFLRDWLKAQLQQVEVALSRMQG